MRGPLLEGQRAPDSLFDLVHSLTALPELGLRVLWLADWVQRTTALEGARALDEALGRAVAGDPRAKEAALPIALYLARSHKAAPLEELRASADAEHLLSLARVLEPGPEPPEVEVEFRVPKYSARELSLGERRSMARRPTRLQIEKLVLDPDPGVLAQLLQCSGLREEDALLVAARRPVPSGSLETLVQSNRWMARSRIRHALILNPYSPHGLVLPLVITLTREDIAIVASSMSINPGLRRAATELMARLPPLSLPPAPLEH